MTDWAHSRDRAHELARSGQVAAAVQLLEGARRHFQAQSDPLCECEVLSDIAFFLEDSRPLNEAQDLAVTVEDEALRLECLVVVAHGFEELEELEFCRVLWNQVVQLGKKLGKHEATIDGLTGLAYCMEESNRNDEAERLYREALQVAVEMLPEGEKRDTYRLNIWSGLGVVLRNKEMVDESFAEYERCIELCEQRNFYAGIVSALMFQISLAEREMDNLELALGLAQRAKLVMEEHLQDDEDLDRALQHNVLSTVAGLHRDAGDLPATLETLQSDLSVVQADGSSPDWMQETLTAIAQVLHALGRYDEAAEVCLRLLGLVSQEEQVEEGDEDEEQIQTRAMVLSTVAVNRRLGGHYDEAIGHHQKTIALFRKLNDEQSVGFEHEALAETLLKAKRFDQVPQAVEVAKQVFTKMGYDRGIAECAQLLQDAVAGREGVTGEKRERPPTEGEEPSPKKRKLE